MGAVCQIQSGVLALMRPRKLHAPASSAGGSGQVSGAVSSLDGLTQQNAPLLDESSAVPRAMHEQVLLRMQTMAIFQVGR